MSRQININRIKVVHDALGDLVKSCVFVGGAIVDLYSNRPAGEVRPTDDIDIIIELLQYNDFAAVEEQLRGKGFVNDLTSGVICRFTIKGVVVDIMPTESTILGFSNRWYPAGFREAIAVRLPGNYEIQILPPAYFIATKLEAFWSRGKGDGRTSTDFEDIVYVLNTRGTIFQEIKDSPGELYLYLIGKFRELLRNAYLEEWISGHLDFNEQSRISYIIGGMEDLINND